MPSNTVTLLAPLLTNAWFHDPVDPANTARPFEWNGGGRSEDHGVVGQGIALAGRTFPVYEYASRANRAVNVPLALPYEDQSGTYGDDWQGDTDYLLAMLESRKPWVYRDDRGRLIYGVLFSLPWADQPWGTSVEVQVNATDFDETLFYNPFSTLIEEE